MAERANRIYKRKRIKDPTNESNYFDVPVIYEMKFNVMQEQSQERWLYLNNSSTSSRKGHTRRVYNVTNQSQYTDVERTDQFNIRDMISQSQESILFLTNNDPPPIQPDGTNSPAHQKVHYVRFFRNNNESDCYGDMEMIDELIIRDNTSQAQEWHYYLRWPELGDVINDPNVPYVVTKGYCDPNLPLASD